MNTHSLPRSTSIPRHDSPSRISLQPAGLHKKSFNFSFRISSPAFVTTLARLIIAAITAFTLLMPATSHARAKRVEHHTTIESVSATSITINAPDGAKTYKIGPHTEIMFKGQDTTVGQLQSGMRVQVTPDAVDETTASVIQADDPPHDPAQRPDVEPSPTPFKFGN